MSRKHTKKRTRENDSLLSASNKRYKPQIPVIDLTKDEDEQPTTTSKKGKNVEQDVECSICYEEIKERGYLDCCDHMFCFPCIYKWSSSSNTCPICKRRFKSIVKEVCFWCCKKIDYEKEISKRWENYKKEENSCTISKLYIR